VKEKKMRKQHQFKQLFFQFFSKSAASHPLCEYAFITGFARHANKFCVYKLILFTVLNFGWSYKASLGEKQRCYLFLQIKIYCTKRSE